MKRAKKKKKVEEDKSASDSFWARIDRNRKKKLCSVCGKKYTYSLQTGRDRDTGKEYCVHDKTSHRDPTKLTSREQEKFGNRKNPKEHAVKGSDGMIRIIETN